MWVDMPWICPIHAPTAGNVDGATSSATTGATSSATTDLVNRVANLELQMQELLRLSNEISDIMAEWH